MLFHHIIQIIINRSAACNSSLNLPLAYQFIYVVAWLMVLNQNASLLHLMQVLFRFLINLRIIEVRLCRQIHLCSVYMEKRIRILFPNGCCLFSIHYIIWKGSYCCCLSLCRSKCFKCTKYCHKILLLSRSVFEKSFQQSARSIHPVQKYFHYFSSAFFKCHTLYFTTIRRLLQSN